MDATASPDGATVAVSVHDTGIGIPEDKLDDIFAPFAQVGACLARGCCWSYVAACGHEHFQKASWTTSSRPLPFGALYCHLRMCRC